MSSDGATEVDGVLSDDDLDLFRRLAALYEGSDKVAIKKLSKNFQKTIVLGHGLSLKVTKLACMCRRNFAEVSFLLIRTYRQD